tara:strand:+ start:3938 stop:4564 length:627 start_codon:yes stop_codon:yes gene_type:complete
MKNLFTVLVILTCSNLLGQGIFDQGDTHLVVPHVGLPEFPIDSTNIATVISAFGDNYQLDDKEEKIKEFLNQRKSHSRENLKHFPLLLELKYEKLGVSFYWLSNDSTQTIRAVKFYHPFKAETQKGIILNKSTMGAVKKAYGAANIHVSGNPLNELTIHEFTEIGIRFRSSISGYSKDNFPPEEVIESAILEEIYISNYQERLLLGSL